MNNRIMYLILLIFAISITSLSCTNKQDSNVSEVSDSAEAENTKVENNSSNNEFNNKSNYSDKRRIVFHESIDDSQIDYLNTLGGAAVSGFASVALTIYELETGIFEGCGTIIRRMEISDEELNEKLEYSYRTGLIYVEDGIESRIQSICSFTEERNECFYIGEDVPYDYKNQKEGTFQQDLPVILKIDGKQATFSVKFNEQSTLVFSGEIINTPDQSNEDFEKTEGIIYINNVWSNSFMGGAGDYNAILLASPEDNERYTGKISINGSGNDLNVINEDVTFSIEKFSEALYEKSGGNLRDKFENMAVFNAAGQEFILLFDGSQVILEPVGKNKYFCGNVKSNEDYVKLENEANKTIEMVSYLYSIKNNETISNMDYSAIDELDPNSPEDLENMMEIAEEFTNASLNNSQPSWFPYDLIPAVNFSADDGFLTTPVIDAQFFKLYITEYYENENIEDLVFYYNSALSKNDNYMEYIDNENGEAVFVFSMGKYYLQVFLQQTSLKLTSVGVKIY